MLEENDPPFYAKLDWQKAKKWEKHYFKFSEIGGPNGLDLMVLYAKKQGVRLEWLEYGDDIHVYVASKVRPADVANLKEREAVYKALEEMNEPMSTNMIMRQCDLKYNKVKSALDDLYQDNYIDRGREPSESGRGRPTIIYWVKKQ